MDAQPPVIDVTGLVGGDARVLDRVAAALVEPCSSWGVFHLVGHDLSEAELRRFDAAMRRFFARSRAEKRALLRTRNNARGYYDEELTKNRPDWKEVFDYGAARREGEADADHSDGVNQWPPGDAGFREALLAHYASCEELALSLLRALCASLGLAPDTLAPHFQGHSSFVRLNHYAPCPDPAAPDAPLFPESGHLGVHHHTDAGALTILYQDAVEGLQVFHDERWITIEPVAGALTVNLADMLQVWSNDAFRSPLHRVITHADRDRYSAPFFLNPRYESVCEPLPGLLSADRPARFRAVSWSHFRDQRSAGDFADYGAEIQIEDYRVP